LECKVRILLSKEPSLDRISSSISSKDLMVCSKISYQCKLEVLLGSSNQWEDFKGSYRHLEVIHLIMAFNNIESNINSSSSSSSSSSYNNSRVYNIR